MYVNATSLRNFIRENNLPYIACRMKYRENEFALDFIHLYEQLKPNSKQVIGTPKMKAYRIMISKLSKVDEDSVQG